MPDYCDGYVSDVIIVIDDEQMPFDQIVESLKSHGVTVGELKPEQHIVEGCIETAKLREIDELPGVNYVRAVFAYAADFPAGHPQDKDTSNREHYPDETSPSYRRGTGYKKI